MFVIERKFAEAAAFALAGAVLTFFGFMHGGAIGLGVTPAVTIAYVIVAVFIYSLSRYPELISFTAPAPAPNEAHPAPAE